MKPSLPLFSFIGIRKVLLNYFVAAHLCFFSFSNAVAQCPAGYYMNTLNWDNMDYLVTTGNYTAWVSASMVETQRFAIGINYLTISKPPAITANGDNTTHTGETGAFGTGADVQFTGDGTITITFNNEVQNVTFTLFDIDELQIATVSATNAASVGQIVTLSGGSTLTVVGSPGLAPTASDLAPSTAVANNTNTANVNVSVAGPVKTITVNVSTINANKEWWLSDINACVLGTFPNDYFNVMQPYTGQPTFIIATSDTNTVSLVNVATGSAKMIFRDTSSPRFINGLAYDPVRNEIYYVHDFTTNPSINKMLKKYNFNTKTISTVLADISTLGIPTFDRGVESAGCSFYDGHLYFGVEANLSPAHNSGRETIIWRIDFDGSGNPVSACQAFGTPADNGSGTVMHDWNDFAVIDSMLIDFNGASSTNGRYTHFNMRTQNIDNVYAAGASSIRPRQTGIAWNDQLYWVYDQIALYNMAGGLGAKTSISGPTALDWTGFAGDATGFRPQSDFGDAPAVYDPVALSPALHMEDTALRLGPTFDQEFTKTSSPLANGDGADEDGIATVNVLDTATTNYLADITVYNNTGANATLIAWFDWDGDLQFEVSEARTATVPHGGPVLQTVNFAWNGINTPLAQGQQTYLRVRLTSAANGMTTSNPTGYFANGEVEDYLIYTTRTLPVNLVNFDARLINKSVKLEWLTQDESNLDNYEVERSADGTNWNTILTTPAKNIAGISEYIKWDDAPLSGKSFYRLKINDVNDLYRYSMIRTVQLNQENLTASVYPNPMDKQGTLKISSSKQTSVVITVYDVMGSKMLEWKENITEGDNEILFNTERFSSGVYTVLVKAGEEMITSRFIKK